MSDEKVYVPPFKIQGIKTKLVPWIRAAARFHGDATWIEPFMGSAVVGLNIAPKNAIFADLNPHIISFYDQLKSGIITSKLVRDFLEEEGALLAKRDGEHYYLVRDRFNEKHDPLDFLFLNRACFNGMIRFNKNNAYNVPYGHKPNRFAKAYVTKIVNQVRHFEQMIRDNNWIFLCSSFEDSIAMADGNAFIYCDPPYIGRHVDYFDSWSMDREAELKRCLLSSGAKFMLSTWDFNQYRRNMMIDSMWGGLEKITRKHFYFVGAREENRNAMTEALLINYEIEAKPVTREYGVRQLQFAFR